jgi:solute carrier family 35 protein E1
MPHSTRASSLSQVPSFKFPNDSNPASRISMEHFPESSELNAGIPPYTLGLKPPNGQAPGERWQPRRDSNLRGSAWTNKDTSTAGGHSRQKSLSDALRTLRTRRGSVSANVHEIGDALKAPVSPKLIVCNPMSRDRLWLIYYRFCVSSGTCQVL